MVFFLFCGARVFGSEVMSTADAYEAKSWSLSLYGMSQRTEPKIKIDGASEIQVPVSGGTSSLFSGSDTEIKMTQHEQATVALITFRPRDGMHYHLKVGQVRSLSVDFSSGSLTNSLEALREGFLWGTGFRWNMTQGTIVSAAMSLDVSYTQTLASLDRFHSNGATSATNVHFEQNQFQGTFNVSRRWQAFEPFGGVKFFRTATKLEDESSKEKISGDTTGVSPFLGLKWDMFDGESLVVEGSLAGEKGVAAGFNIKF